MATRKKFAVTVNGTTEHTFAWNSAISKGEAMMRSLAREQGQMYSGGTSLVTGKIGDMGAVYTRTWTGDSNGERHMVHMTRVA